MRERSLAVGGIQPGCGRRGPKSKKGALSINKIERQSKQGRDINQFHNKNPKLAIVAAGRTNSAPEKTTAKRVAHTTRGNQKKKEKEKENFGDDESMDWKGVMNKKKDVFKTSPQSL